MSNVRTKSADCELKPRPAARTGALIVNADDWGRDRDTTDRILDCVRCGALSSASGMVFMEDSERAAELALTHGADIGLHLNFTTRYSGRSVPRQVNEHQQRLASFVRRRRFAPVIFHPFLQNSFRYLVEAQCEEFAKLYGHVPARVDGHHHMHLAANVLLADLLPKGTIARRNFSFEPGEKSFANRAFRRFSDTRLARRHRMTEFFFSLPPLAPRERLSRIFALASEHSVEVETHPADPEEYRFLMNGQIFEWAGSMPIAPRYVFI